MRAPLPHALLVLAMSPLMCMAGATQEWQPIAVKEFIAAKRSSDALYAGLVRYEMKVRMISYRSWDDAVPLERVEASVRRAADRFRSEVGGIVTLQDKRIRVIYDPEEGRLFAADPVELADAWALGAVDHILNAVASCFKRIGAGSVEYKLVFAQGAVYDHTIVRYDTQGWLRSTSTIWRQSIAEDPGQPMSPVYRPRLDVEYGTPRPLEADMVEPDPWQFVRETPVGLSAVGQWKGAEVIDSRFRP